MNSIPQLIPHYSVSDYQQWAGDWELWNGVPIARGPSPLLPHGAFAAILAFAFQNALKRAKTNRWTLIQEIDWIIDPHTVVRPDLMLIAGRPTNSHLTVPPVLVVEILSPATEDKDRNAKFLLYQLQGVRYYVIADPISQHLEVFQLESRVYRQLPAADPLMLALDDVDVIALSFEE